MSNKEQRKTYQRPQITTPRSSKKSLNVKRVQAMGFGGIIKPKQESSHKCS